MRVFSRALSFLLASGVAACSSAGPVADPPAPTDEVGAAPRPVESVTPTPPAPPPTGVGGVFSAAQADEGRDTFRSLCTECHFSREFSDAQFKFKWSRRSAGDLYETIFTSMPESAPGILSPEESVALVTYILRMNGFEPGASELAADRDALDAISLASIRD